MSNRPKAIPIERRIAAAAIAATLKGGGHLDLAIEEGFRRRAEQNLSREIRQAVWSICYSYFRRRGAVGKALRELLDRPLKRDAIEAEIWIGMGLVEVLFTDTPDHAAVHTAVEAISRHKNPKVRHLKNLTNAVLRRAQRERDDLLAKLDDPALALPRWLATRWQDRFGAEAEAVFTALTTQPPTDLSLKDMSETVTWAEKLGGEVILDGSLRLSAAGDIARLPGFADGAWWVQDLAASLPARILAPKPSEAVLDLCAAPGGKTLQLAAAGADVTALEISAERAKRIHENLARTSLTANVVVGDALSWDAAEAYDAILLDAPCSATGTIRRHPELPWVRGKIDLAGLADTQTELLRRAAGWLKPGGRLVYAVCSLEAEEGPDIVAKVLSDNLGLSLTEILPEALGPAAAARQPDGTVQTRPDMLADKGGMDGFFIACFQKNQAA